MNKATVCKALGIVFSETVRKSITGASGFKRDLVLGVMRHMPEFLKHKLVENLLLR